MLITNQAYNRITYNRFHLLNCRLQLSPSSAPPPLDLIQLNKIPQNIETHGKLPTITVLTGRNPIGQSIKFINYTDKHATNLRSE